MRALLVVLTAFLAASPPLRMALGWGSAGLAEAIGIPYLRNLPSGTVAIILVTVIIHSLLMIVVVRQVWKLARIFETGVFFSKANVASLKRAGIYLIVISALSLIATGLAILSVLLSGREIEGARIWGQVFNLPVGTLVCGLLSLVMARAFERARRMATEARYTV